MGVSDILQGHVNEALGLHKTTSEYRMGVCRECPLYINTVFGPTCNSRLWINLETGDISTTRKDGYKNGCGCRLKAKTTLPNAKCPIEKW